MEIRKRYFWSCQPWSIRSIRPWGVNMHYLVPSVSWACISSIEKKQKTQILLLSNLWPTWDNKIRIYVFHTSQNRCLSYRIQRQSSRLEQGFYEPFLVLLWHHMKPFSKAFEGPHTLLLLPSMYQLASQYLKILLYLFIHSTNSYWAPTKCQALFYKLEIVSVTKSPPLVKVQSSRGR